MIEQSPPEKPGKSKRSPIGCLGWILLCLGLILFLQSYWFMYWDIILLSLGVLFYFLSFFRRDYQYLFPGTTLIICSSSLILRDLGYISFPDWHFWPILFSSIGMGLLMLWLFKESRSWILFPAGFLLVCGSVGLFGDSWWDYQRWLNRVFNLWPMLLIIFGVLLLFLGYLRLRSEKGGCD